MKLSALISDGMVLQRGKENTVWGNECAGGEKIEVTIDSKTVTCVADPNGEFKITLPDVDAGGPYELTIAAANEKIVINDVYCGDVYLLTGQSNMEIPLQRCMDMYEDEIRQMDLPYIHYFEVPKEGVFGEPLKDIYKGKWLPATQENLYPMSALGVFFARLAHADFKVPIGLIQTGVGGTHIESYLSEEHVIKMGRLLRELAKERGEDITSCNCDKNDSCKVCYEKQLTQDKDAEWVAMTAKKEVEAQQKWSETLDSRDLGLKEHWERKTSLYGEGEDAKFVNAPGFWENMTDNKELETIRGSVWLLKNVNIPSGWTGREVRLYLGTLVDADDTYVNGEHVGNTGYRFPPRRYRIPAGVLHEGVNTIVIRLIVNGRTGGFVPEMPYYLSLGDEKIELEGKWEFKIGGSLDRERDGDAFEMSDVTFFNWKPTAQYNGMVYPLRNLKFKGVLFYQGESNCTHTWEYEYLMIDMTECLRELLGEELPFGFIQLPRFGEPGTKDWDELRESQARAAAVIPNSCIADIYDLGFTYELHPQTKKEAAERLYEKMKPLL